MLRKLGAVAYGCDPSHQEVAAGRSEVHGHSWLQWE